MTHWQTDAQQASVPQKQPHCCRDWSALSCRQLRGFSIPPYLGIQQNNPLPH